MEGEGTGEGGGGRGGPRRGMYITDRSKSKRQTMQAGECNFLSTTNAIALSPLVGLSLPRSSPPPSLPLSPFLPRLHLSLRLSSATHKHNIIHTTPKIKVRTEVHKGGGGGDGTLFKGSLTTRKISSQEALVRLNLILSLLTYWYLVKEDESWNRERKMKQSASCLRV